MSNKFPREFLSELRMEAIEVAIDWLKKQEAPEAVISLLDCTGVIVNHLADPDYETKEYSDLCQQGLDEAVLDLTAGIYALGSSLLAEHA